LLASRGSRPYTASPHRCGLGRLEPRAPMPSRTRAAPAFGAEASPAVIACGRALMIRPLAYLSLPCVLALAPLAAAAEPATLFGQPVNSPPELTDEEIAARRAAFEKHLEDNDLIHAGSLVVPRAQVEEDFT